MNIDYDESYTYIFHTPGIEPWVSGFLKNKSPKSVVDVGCGLGFTALLLRLHLNYHGYLVGLDTNKERVLKARKFGLYDDFLIADASKSPFRPKTFDILISLEVFHQLPADVLDINQKIVSEGGSIILALPNLPIGISVKDLFGKGYDVYKCLLRGLLLINLKTYKVLSIRNSVFFKMIAAILVTSIPFLRLIGIFENGSLLAFMSENTA